MNERALVSLAIDRSNRPKYHACLSDAVKRRKVLGALNHRPPLDDRYTTWFSSFAKAVATVKVDAKARVCILSYDTEIDGSTMSFEEALFEVPRHGWGTIIGVSEHLAVYYGECGEWAAVIRRPEKGS